MAKNTTCTGTEGREAKKEGTFGRLICTTCGNCVLPNADGKLRKHVAKVWAYGAANGF